VTSITRTSFKVKKLMNTDNISVTLITQGKHRFYSATMNIDLVAESGSTNPREVDPVAGFQRTLDETRANSIAKYIRDGGTIPSSIILSAQSESNLTYNARNKTISFNVSQSSFLILDGQHRVYGFRKLMDEDLKYRVPVIIYSELTPIEEARLFIDINTLQRAVPKELLLDIKKLAERENDDEALLNELFTNFEISEDSYLLNKLSRFDKQKGKISKVTFYDSMRPILKEFNINDIDKLYRIMNSYFIAAGDVTKENGFALDEFITKATAFKILVSHARAIITVVSDNNPNDIEKISEYRRYLMRSLPSSIEEIMTSKAYLKSVELLDRKLLRRNVTI
jgi:DGQHR domain-containing protein